MPWSDKKIEDAILEAKMKKAIFVVYVVDDNNKGILENIVRSPDIADIISGDRIVAITIGSNSQSYNFFQNIYQLVPVPSIFFIGENGWPLEIITTELPVEAVLARIRRLVKQPGDLEAWPEGLAPETSLTAIPGTSSQSPKAETTTLSDESKQSNSLICNSKPVVPSTTKEGNEEQKLAVSETSSLKSNCEVSSRDSSESVCPSEHSGAVTPKRSEISKAQVNETTKQTSSHTSTLDNSTQSISRSSEDLSDKDGERVKQVQTVKMGSNLGINQPQTVTDQLETRGQGIVRTAARSNNPQTPGFFFNIGGWMRNLLYGGRPTTLRASQVATEDSIGISRVPSIHSSEMDGWPPEARIQFRRPDGSTQTELFVSTTTIGDLREYVQNNISLPFRSFSLSTSYPRLEFTAQHDNVPIGALGLAPRSVILIIPGSQVSQQSGLPVHALWTMIVWPFSAIYSFLMMLNVWLFSRDSANDGTSSSPSQQRAEQQPESVTYQQSSQSRNMSGARRRAPTSSSIHRDGNVHRLSNKSDDSDEDNNTWNGNSTQQM